VIGLFSCNANTLNTNDSIITCHNSVSPTGHLDLLSDTLNHWQPQKLRFNNSS